jgi:hypothetical protein
MGIDPKERFTKSDKAGNVQDQVSTSREKPTAGAPNLLTAGELQLASDTNAGGNALSLAHCKFAGENCTYCRRIETFARGNVLPLENIAMRRQ